jgi:hypothetical protein
VACAGKANSHVVVKDADVHGLDERRQVQVEGLSLAFK